MRAAPLFLGLLLACAACAESTPPVADGTPRPARAVAPRQNAALRDLLRPDAAPATDDERRYAIGWRYQQAADFGHARDAYLSLVDDFEGSRRVAYAHFALGEMALAESGSYGVGIDEARQAFLRVLEDPAEQGARAGELAAFALLRLGQVEEAAGNVAEAHDDYARLAREHPTSVAAKELSRPRRGG